MPLRCGSQLLNGVTQSVSNLPDIEDFWRRNDLSRKDSSTAGNPVLNSPEVSEHDAILVDPNSRLRSAAMGYLKRGHASETDPIGSAPKEL